jgi:E3 ubiquitin-protein ligase DOA10
MWQDLAGLADPDDLEEQEEQEEQEECPVCLEAVAPAEIAYRTCKVVHAVHKSCWLEYTAESGNSLCLICREPVL